MRSRSYGTTIICWTLALLLFGVMGWVVMVVRDSGPKIADRMLGEVRVSIMLIDSVSDKDIAELERTVRLVDGVVGVSLINKSQAMEEFSLAVGHQLSSEVSLPSSLEVLYTGGQATLSRLKTRTTGVRYVRELVYDQNIVVVRDKLFDQLSFAAQIIGAFITFVVLTLLYFAIKSWAVRQVREVIVRRGFVASVAGATISAVVVFVANYYAVTTLPEFALSDELVGLVAASMVIVGGFLGVIYGYILMQKQ